MKKDLTDLFSLTPSDGRKNYVETEPDPEAVANAEEATKAKKDPNFKMTKASEAPKQSPKQSPEMDFSSMWSDEAKRPPVATRPQAPLAGENVTTVYPEHEDFQNAPMDISGEHAASTAPAPTPKGSVDTSKGMEIPWGQIITGALPYALEGLFGGGKYMGSAGAGSAAGSKAYSEMEKDRLASIAKAQELKDKAAFEDKKFTADQDYKKAMLGLKEKELSQESYTFEPGMVNGQKQYVGLGKKTGATVETKVTPVDKPMSARDRNSAAYLDLAERKEERLAKSSYAKMTEDNVSAYNAAKEYAGKYRDLKSFDKQYAQTADTALPENLKQERLAVRRLLYSMVVENAGKSQTAQEFSNNMGNYGIGTTPKSWEEAIQNPMGFVDRTLTKVNRDALRGAIDKTVTDIQTKFRLRESTIPKKYVDEVNAQAGLVPFDLPAYQPQGSASTATKTMAKSIADEIRKEKGW